MARATTRAANVAAEVGTMSPVASTDVAVIVIGVGFLIVPVRVLAVVEVVVLVAVVSVQAGVGTCLGMVSLATCNSSQNARPAACTENRTGLVSMDVCRRCMAKQRQNTKLTSCLPTCEVHRENYSPTDSDSSFEVL